MRVLQIHNRYANPGGEDTVVGLERAALRDGGHHVDAFEVENQTGISAVPSLLASPWNVSSARALDRLVTEVEPDVAHVHNTWFRLSPSVISSLKKRSVPVVATIHNYRQTCLNGQLFRENEICTRCVGVHPLPGVRLGCYRGSVIQSGVMAVSVSLGRINSFWGDSVDRFVAMTEFQRGLLAEAGIPRDKIGVKPHFVEDRGARREPPSASDTVLFVGRLSEAKGIRTLLAAWAVAEPRNVRLVVAGDGPLRAELEAVAPPSVEFAGWLSRDAVARRLREARALLFPSTWYEAFGMVLIEAMAARAAVVASDLGGIPEVMQSDGTTLLTPPGDVAAWTERIRDLDEGAIPVDEVGVANRSKYEASYTVERGLIGLERLYGSVRHA